MENTVRSIRIAYQAASVSSSTEPGASTSVPVGLSADLLGLSIFLGQPSLGVSPGAEVRHYYSNSLCRVLSSTKTSGSVTLLTWSPSTQMYQLVQTQHAHVYTSSPAPLPASMRLSLAPFLVDILHCMRSCLQPLLSDHLSVRKFEHPYLRSVLLQKLRPLDALSFSLILRSLTSDPVSIGRVLQYAASSVSEGEKDQEGHKRDTLVGLLSEAAFRLQSTPADASGRPVQEHGQKQRAVWKAERSLMSRWDAVRAPLELGEGKGEEANAAGETSQTPASVLAAPGSVGVGAPKEDEQAYDYLFRSLHISSETFTTPGPAASPACLQPPHATSLLPSGPPAAVSPPCRPAPLPSRSAPHLACAHARHWRPTRMSHMPIADTRTP